MMRLESMTNFSRSCNNFVSVWTKCNMLMNWKLEAPTATVSICLDAAEKNKNVCICVCAREVKANELYSKFHIWKYKVATGVLLCKRPYYLISSIAFRVEVKKAKKMCCAVTACCVSTFMIVYDVLVHTQNTYTYRQMQQRQHGQYEPSTTG